MQYIIILKVDCLHKKWQLRIGEDINAKKAVFTNYCNTVHTSSSFVFCSKISTMLQYTQTRLPDGSSVSFAERQWMLCAVRILVAYQLPDSLVELPLLSADEVYATVSFTKSQKHYKFVLVNSYSLI